MEQTLYHYFPSYNGKFICAWSGLRVLPKSNNPNANKRRFSKQARDTELVMDRKKKTKGNKYFFGGKLTAYRITAEDVAILAERTLGVPKKYTKTSEIKLVMPT